MELILWRHAEAEDGVDDMQRALTSHGRRQAARMANWLKQQVPGPWRILVSPARRTRETAEALHLPYAVEEPLRPGSSAVSVLRSAGWPEGEGSVLIIGHQPSLGQAAALAVSGQADGWSLRKGAMFWLSSRDREGVIPVQLRASLSPDLIKD